MLDEFPALGRLDFFESALAFMAGYGIKAFLIAQSLNQIEKAYGQNNAILDNCHVRVSFATNDERTAKRISDALGTATEMRAMKNYAGHRLSPWLGHLMVSRSETARALLRPGEVMQLPPDDEIVMAAGIPPIRARKARYFLDPRFTTRVLEAPRPVPARNVKQAADGWSGLTPVEVMQLPEIDKSGAATAAPEADSQAENSGIRQEPGLPEHEDVAPKIDRPFNPFDPDADTAQDETAQNRQAIDRAMRRNARNASLDPGDGIEL